MALLPITGREIALRELSGGEDLLLLAAHRSVPQLVRDLLAALADEPAAIDELPVGDAEALLLSLRRLLLGDVVSADMLCPSAPCSTRIDISFQLDAYLQHHRPRPLPRGVTREDDWLVDERSGAAFRAPTLGDQIAIAGTPRPAARLLERCTRDGSPAPRPQRMEGVLRRAAPTLSNYVSGACPECGTDVEAYFDVEQFVVRELRSAARNLHDDIHLIASAYGWSEGAIVALPRSRRVAYAERIRSAEAS